MAVDPIPAATVVLLREREPSFEVFMLRRHHQIAFMGGAYVFPGGRLDATDAPAPNDEEWLRGMDSVDARLGLDPQRAVAHGVAAVRELFEEAGVLLARAADGAMLTFADPNERARYERHRHDVHQHRLTLRELAARERITIALDELIPFAHWVTPAIEPRRFDARFFVARVPPHQHPVHEERESTESRWVTPADALDLSRRDEIWLPVPTWQTLRALAPLPSIDTALDWARQQPIVRTEPVFHEEGGEKMFLVPGDPLFPTEAGQFVGEETRFVFDGSRWRPMSPQGKRAEGKR
jgi:8-oxo-dGTP pyrophosphatase MutT (NUDIX family)